MYISQLKIHGFKSFAKKEILHFGEGITTIVGPNGCGKTNIVDAIRWVLGEQKYSVLRSGKMEDVIFNGAEHFKPLSVSEVSLTVHNDRGKLPIEYTDVEIGRRIYRNGESEYFINKTPCRLKDIQNLFIDTGMGADAYSVIELKMIEQILSETGDERKRMFEEAAGINKYKNQRKSAFRKFEATTVDLERINDIIAEVDNKVHSLNLQLKRYKRHAQLTKKLQEKEIDLAKVQLWDLSRSVLPLKTKIEELEHLRKSKITDEDIREKELEQIRGTYQEQKNELNAIQAELATFDERRENLRHDILIRTEQSRSAEVTIKRLNSEQENNQNKKVQLKKHIRDYTEEITSVDPRIEEKLNNYKLKKQEYDIIETGYKNAQTELENIQSRRWDEQRKVADQSSLYERTKSLIKETKTKIDQLEQKVKKLEQKQDYDSGIQKELELKKLQIKNDLEKQKTMLLENEQKLSDLQEQRHGLTLKHHTTLTKVEALESQLQFYRELVVTKEDYPEGIRFVLDHPEEFPHVIGTIADLFHVKEDYRTAIESALGELAHCLVVKDRPTALAVLKNIQDQKAGELSIIPLKEISDIVIPMKPLPENPTVIGRASELIESDKQVAPVAEFLLGNVLIVKDFDSALKEKAISGWNLVDLKGAYSGADYIIKNRQESDHGSIIGRRKKIETLDMMIGELVDKAQKVKEKLDVLDAEINENENRIERISSEVEAIIDEQTGVETEIIRNHYRQSQSLETIQETTHDLTVAKKNLHQLTDSLDVLTPKIQEAEVRLANIDKKVENASKLVENARQKRDSFNQILQDIRIDLINLENQRDNLKFQKKSAEEVITELSDRGKKIILEVESLEQKKVTLNEQVEANETELKRVNAKIQHQKSVLDLKQAANSSTYKEIEELEKQIREEQRNRETLLDELKQCEIKTVEYDQQIKMIQQRIQEKYDTTLKIPQPDKSSSRPAGILDDLELDIQRIERSIENIGPINMAVQIEYEEETKRLTLLNEQRDDLVAAEENLRTTIQKIDRVARKQFKDTFDKIRDNFSKLFVLFFEGGSASLSLIGDPDPLESDIGIQAQPPGKKNQSLRMLSAGEKALTAIALLFSIYQVKPSPYCILDEVDAPLDDINIKKFTRVLSKFSEETQFIVVTHNKLTMEASNFLYGVTMAQKGVSKLVSVKLNA